MRFGGSHPTLIERTEARSVPGVGRAGSGRLGLYLAVDVGVLVVFGVSEGVGVGVGRVGGVHD